MKYSANKADVVTERNDYGREISIEERQLKEKFSLKRNDVKHKKKKGKFMVS